jgi:UDP-GlcNAc:undecaprenyl-phosphate/decaprenyl-phosphate GlcNAc-1-phosphate transferase
MALAFLIAVGVSLALQPLLKHLLQRWQIVDVPVDRSSHRAVTVRGGGVAVVAGLSLATVVVAPGASARLVVLGALLLGAVGLLDDLRGLSARVRLFAQAVLGAGLALALVGLTGGSPTIAVFVVLTLSMALWLVAYVNAFNFMDGVHGISGMNAVFTGCFYAWLGYEYDVVDASVVGIALAGAAVGFLPWNIPRARMFLGDVGSYAIGTVCALLAGLLFLSGVPVVLVCAPLLLYVLDTGGTLARRMLRGASLLAAHRDHTYQRLARQESEHVWVSALTVVCSVVVVSGALLATEGRVLLGGALMALPLLTYLGLPWLRSAGPR